MRHKDNYYDNVNWPNLTDSEILDELHDLIGCPDYEDGIKLDMVYDILESCKP
jgi:hypothetical protein